ncbi:hypothetical protein SESBI_40066 [Sesbania bispinosa]|nr:hypothetical protein SESBI_40066 [Sesbania bispinosa]
MSFKSKSSSPHDVSNFIAYKEAKPSDNKNRVLSSKKKSNDIPENLGHKGPRSEGSSTTPKEKKISDMKKVQDGLAYKL